MTTPNGSPVTPAALDRWSLTLPPARATDG